MLQDSLENNEGRPSPMLSIRDLSIEQVENFIKQTNNHLPSEKHIAISLVNGARNVVVSGPPESLYGLNLTLRNNKAPSGLDQARIPFSERKLKFLTDFYQSLVHSIRILLEPMPLILFITTWLMKKLTFHQRMLRFLFSILLMVITFKLTHLNQKNLLF